MTSLGDVSISVSLDESKLDQQLSALENRELKTLPLGAKLDTKSLETQLKGLAAGDYSSIAIELTPDIKGFERKLRELPKSLVDCIEVCLHPDIKGFQDKLKRLELDCISVKVCADTDELKSQIEKVSREISSEIAFQVKAQVQATIEVQQSKEQRHKDNKDNTDVAAQKLAAVSEKLSNKINEAIDTSLKNLTGAVTAPFQGVARGFFEGVGQTVSREITNGILGSFQKTLDISFKGIGGNVGGIAAKELGKALGLKKIPAPRTKKRDSDEEPGSATATSRRPRTPKGGQPGTAATELEKELKAIAQNLGDFTKFVSKAGGGADKFGIGAVKAASSALELASAIASLQSTIKSLTKETTERSDRKAKSSNKTAPTAKSAPTSSVPETTKSKTTPALQNRTQFTPIVPDEAKNVRGRGFLKGDRATLQPENARAQVEAVRARLERQLSQLQQVKGISADVQQKRVASLYRAIAVLEQRIAADVANPEIPEAVRRSLGQLKASNSKLAQTKTEIESEQKKIASELKRTQPKTPPVSKKAKLPGIIKKGIASGIGASVLGAGQVFAAPGAGVGAGGLGLLSSLPFDPTLGLAAAGVAGTFGTAKLAGKIVPSLFRKAGLSNVANLLETEVINFANLAISKNSSFLFKQAQKNISNIFAKQTSSLISKAQQAGKLIKNNSGIARGIFALHSQIQSAVDNGVFQQISNTLKNNSGIARGIFALHSQARSTKNNTFQPPQPAQPSGTLPPARPIPPLPPLPKQPPQPVDRPVVAKSPARPIPPLPPLPKQPPQPVDRPVVAKSPARPIPPLPPLPKQPPQPVDRPVVAKSPARPIPPLPPLPKQPPQPVDRPVVAKSPARPIPPLPPLPKQPPQPVDRPVVAKSPARPIPPLPPLPKQPPQPVDRPVVAKSPARPIPPLPPLPKQPPQPVDRPVVAKSPARPIPPLPPLPKQPPQPVDRPVVAKSPARPIPPLPPLPKQPPQPVDRPVVAKSPARPIPPLPPPVKKLKPSRLKLNTLDPVTASRLREELAFKELERDKVLRQKQQDLRAKQSRREEELAFKKLKSSRLKLTNLDPVTASRIREELAFKELDRDKKVKQQQNNQGAKSASRVEEENVKEVDRDNAIRRKQQDLRAKQARREEELAFKKLKSSRLKLTNLDPVTASRIREELAFKELDRDKKVKQQQNNQGAKSASRVEEENVKEVDRNNAIRRKQQDLRAKQARREEELAFKKLKSSRLKLTNLDPVTASRIREELAFKELDKDKKVKQQQNNQGAKSARRVEEENFKEIDKDNSIRRKQQDLRAKQARREEELAFKKLKSSRLKLTNLDPVTASRIREELAFKELDRDNALRRKQQSQRVKNSRRREEQDFKEIDKDNTLRRKQENNRAKQARKNEEAAVRRTDIGRPQGVVLKRLGELNQLLRATGLGSLDYDKTRVVGSGFTGTAFADGNGRILKLSQRRPSTQRELEERAINQNTAAAAGLAPKLLAQRVVKGKEFNIQEQVVGDNLNTVAKNMRKSIKGLSDDLIKETAQFAAQLHKGAGVAHRDLHFGNLFRNKQGQIQAIDFDNSVNLASLSEKDRQSVIAKDKRQLLRNLQKAYKGKLTPDQLQEVFNQAYEAELAKVKAQKPLGKVRKQRLRDVGFLSQKFFSQLFDQAEDAFFSLPIFKGFSSKRKRAIVGDAAGFLFSGAALAAPGATLTTLGAPLIAALTPLIATIGLVANALKPLVGVVSQTLQQTEPLNARFQYVTGSKQGAQAEKSFVQGVAEQYNIPVLPSLDQFSKLSAAVKGTRLQGKSLKDLFEGIAVASKALQLNTQDLNLVMYAFTQIASKQRLSAEEVRLQLAEKFPGIINLLSKAVGVSVAEFNNLLETGKLVATDVFPKLGAALKKEYGDAAVAASNNFIGALTKVENAIFKLKEGVANTLAPLFSTVANTLGNALNLFAQNAEKIVPILSVVLIGAAAQFFVGLTTILAGSKVITVASNFLVNLFARSFATLTPFAVGVVSDFLDDIFGAKYPVMENMMKGVYNVVLGTILVVSNLADAVKNLFADLPKLPQNNAFSGLGDTLSAVGNALKPLGGILRGTVVEFVALSLILAQTYVLAQQGLTIVLAQLGTTVAGLGAAFVQSVKSGQVFSSVLSTLTAGLDRFQIANVAATAAFILFFAKADFSNELGSKFDKLGDRMVENLDRIREALKKTTDEAGNFKLPELKSKGFDLTFGLGDTFGGGPFKTDDVVKQMRDSVKQGNQRRFEQGRISKQELDRRNKSADEMKTIAEKQFDDNILKLSSRADESAKAIDTSGLLDGTFGTNAAGKALAGIRVIDSEIKQLQGRKVDLLSGADASSQEVIDQVARIDAQVRDLLGKRDQIKQPIEAVKTSVLENVKILQDALKDINDSDLPQPFKQQQRNIIEPALALAERAKSKLEGLNAIDLSPLGKEFTKVTKEVEKLETALEKGLNKINLESTQAQSKIQADLAAGKITSDTAARETTDEELKGLTKKEKDLDAYINNQKANLKQLLAVPEPTPDQTKEIDRVKKDIETRELELAQTTLQRNQKTYEGKRQTSDRLIRDFQRDNNQAQLTAQNAEAQRQARIKQRQLAGDITPEQAELEITGDRTITAKSDLAEAKRQLKEFAALKKTGRLGIGDPNEVVQREAELRNQESAATLRLIEAEIAKREQAKQKRIQDLEEVVTKEQVLSETAKTRTLNDIKSRQLRGELTPDQAALQTNNAEIRATEDSITLAKFRASEIKRLRADGTLTAKEAADKEREIQRDLAQYEGQLVDQRLQKQQQAREKALRDLEVANRKAEAAIASSQTETELAIKRNQLKNAPTEDADAIYGIALDKSKLDATTKQVTTAQNKIAQLNRDNFATQQEYEDRLIELQTELGNLRVQQADEQIALDRRVYEQAIKNIQKRTQYEEEALDRTKRLLESRVNLTKSLAEAAQTVNDSQVQVLEQALELQRRLAESGDSGQEGAIASLLNRLGVQGSELDIIRQKQQLEDESARSRLQALEAEQRLTRTLTELDLRRERIAAQQAVSEAETAHNRALVARLEAVATLNDAKQKGEQALIDAAAERLRFNDLILKSTQQQLDNAKANLGIQSQLADETLRALSASQQAALTQASNAEKVREVKQDLELIDARSASSRSGSSSATPSGAGDRATAGTGNGTSRKKPLSLFEQSRQRIYDIPEIRRTVGLAPAHNLNVDQSKHAGLDRNTSAEAELKRQLGLDPFESAESYLKRLSGLDPTESAESYFKKPRQIFLGADSSGSFGDLNLRYKPSVNSLDELQRRYKPVAEGFDELQQKYAPKDNTGFTSFTESLKAANKGIEQKLDQLNQTMAQAAAAPRNLYVSSSSPVSDASHIYSEITRQSVLAAGLG